MKKKRKDMCIDNTTKKISDCENNQDFCINFLIRQLLYYKKIYGTVKNSRPLRIFKKKYQEWKKSVEELEKNIAETEAKILKISKDNN